MLKKKCMKTKVLTLSLLISIIANVYAQVGVNTSTPVGTFHVDGAKDNPTSGVINASQQANDLVVLSDGRVGIGTTAPDASSLLEINANGLVNGSKKGFLGPKVALSSNTDITTIPSPAIGLLVYNTGASSLAYKGYIFWNGTEWRTLSGSSLAVGTVGSIKCNSVSLYPSTYTQGTAYTGALTVPYTNANGGTYPDQVIGPVNGLTARLTGGNFEEGSGQLQYRVTGTPTVSSPSVTVFNISLGGQSCAASVGEGDVIELGEKVYYKATINATSYGTTSGTGVVLLSDLIAATPGQPALPTIGGKLRLDALFVGNSVQSNGAVTINPVLYNITTSPIKLWFSAMTTIDNFNAGNYLLAAGNYVGLDNGLYYNYGYNDIEGTTTPRTNAYNVAGAGNNEVQTVDVVVDSKWYRIYYFPIVNNNNQPTSNSSAYTREIYLSVERLY